MQNVVKLGAKYKMDYRQSGDKPAPCLGRDKLREDDDLNKLPANVTCTQVGAELGKSLAKGQRVVVG